MDPAKLRLKLKQYHLQAETLRLEEYFGRKPTLSPEEIEDTFSDLFSISTIASLRSAGEDRPGLGETGRRALRTLRHIAELGFLAKRTTAISAELRKCRDSVSFSYRSEALGAGSAAARLGEQQDPVIRREIYGRLADAENICSDLLEEEILQIQSGARELGYSGLAGLFEVITGMDFKLLAREGRNFLADTEAAYFNLLGAVAAEANLDPKGLGLCDLRFVSETIERKEFFPGDQLSYYYAHILDNFGFSAGEIPQIILKRVSAAKPTATFQTYFPAAGFLCISQQDGVGNYVEFLRSFGRAQMNAWTSGELFEEYPEFVFAPDEALSGGYAILFQSLLADRDFIKRNFFLQEENMESKIITENSFRVLFEVRRQILRFIAESEIFASKPVKLGEAGERFAGEFKRILGFECRKEQIMREISRDFSAQRNLRSIMFGFGLREYLRDRYDFHWWKKRACFEELIDLWNTSGRHGAEELAALVGFESSLDLLAESISNGSR